MARSYSFPGGFPVVREWGTELTPQVKACYRESHSSSRVSKTYGHKAFQITHIHATVIDNGRATLLITAINQSINQSIIIFSVAQIVNYY